MWLQAKTTAPAVLAASYAGLELSRLLSESVKPSDAPNAR
jgi:hypothetical protein